MHSGMGTVALGEQRGGPVNELDVPYWMGEGTRE